MVRVRRGAHRGIALLGALVFQSGVSLAASDANGPDEGAADRKSSEASAGASPFASEGASATADPECDALFGDPDVERANETRRRRRLRFTQAGPAYIDIVHIGGWSQPQEIAIRGLTLVDTGFDEDGAPEALVEVEEELGFCEAGTYAIQVDDAIGARGRVLAIYDDVVLLEHDQDLRYVRAQSYVGRPVFKLSWQSSFAIETAPSGGSGSSSKSRVRRSRRRKR
ncbi:MAG: hypothetical protein ACFB9M_04165 [Myxococcota bacterium]